MHPASNPLDVQHGGKHYKGLAIQPIQYGTANAYDPCAFSVMKYISRYVGKEGHLSLQKAYHFVALRVEMIGLYGKLRPAVTVIPVEEFIRANTMPPEEAEILRDLHMWATQVTTATDQEFARIIQSHIVALASLHYPGEKIT